MRRFAVTVAALVLTAGCGSSDVTGAGCVTDLGSGEELCGADAKRFCSDLAKQRGAERRVARHDFSEQRRLAAQNARDLELSADIQAQLDNARVKPALSATRASSARRPLPGGPTSCRLGQDAADASTAITGAP